MAGSNPSVSAGLPDSDRTGHWSVLHSQPYGLSKDGPVLGGEIESRRLACGQDVVGSRFGPNALDDVWTLLVSALAVPKSGQELRAGTLDPLGLGRLQSLLEVAARCRDSFSSHGLPEPRQPLSAC